MKGNKVRSYKVIYTITKLVFLVLIIALIGSSFIYYKISTLFVNRVNIDLIEVSKLARDTQGEEVSFKSREGNLTLMGTFFSSDFKSNKTLILVHGFDENRFMSGRTEKIVKYLTPLGYNVFTVDLRGHGQSEGRLISFGYNEKYDVLGAIDYMKERGKEGEKIALLGFSMGAIAIIEAAGEDTRIDALIADSPVRDLKLFLSSDLKNLPNKIDHLLEKLEAASYCSIIKYIPFKSQGIMLTAKLYGVDFSEVSPINTVQKFTEQPILLIHGKCDKFISYTNSEEIFKLARNNPVTEIWITEKADHLESLQMYPEEYLEKLKSFLGKHM